MRRSGLPPITEDYLSLHFDEMPSLPIFGGGDSTQIVSHAGLTGSCPDLPTSLDGSTDYIQIYRRLLGKNQVLHNETTGGIELHAGDLAARGCFHRG